MPENPQNPAWKNQGPAKKDGPKAPAWKQDAGAQAPGGPRDWQAQHGTAATPPKPWSKYIKLVIGLGLLGALAYAGWVVVTMPQPGTRAGLVLLGSSYDVNLAIPHNAFGWKGLSDLKDLANEGGSRSQWESQPVGPRLAYSGKEIDGEKSWKKQWDEATKESNDKAVILFLAFHGGADGKGPFLFLNDERGQELVYLQDVLKDLKTRLATKKTLLILEPAQAGAHWTSGMLRNDFVAALKKNLESEILKQPNLLVMCASDVNQQSWASEEWGQTIFTHYLIEGMLGKAVASGEWVTAGDLFRYVSENVKNTAQAMRGVAQTPIIIGDKKLQELDLFRIGANENKSAPVTSRKPDTKKLTDLWSDWRTLQETIPHPAVYSPHLWRRYQDSLLRYEQLSRAGDPTKRLADLEDRLNSLKSTMRDQARFDLARSSLSYALPAAEALGIRAPWSDKELQGAIEILWNTKAEELRKALSETVKQLSSKSNVPGDDKLPALFLTKHLLEHLATHPAVTASDLKSSVKEAAKARRLADALLGGSARPAEAHFLLMLLEHLHPTAPQEALPQLKLALQVRLLAERAALAISKNEVVNRAHPYSEVVFSWIQDKVLEADKNRRLGEDWLFGEGASHWNKANEHLSQAGKQYGDALADAEVIRDAMDKRDRIMAELPYYAAWLAQQRLFAHDPNQAKRLQDVLPRLDQLAKSIDDLTLLLDQGAFNKFPKDEELNPRGRDPKELLKSVAKKVWDESGAIRASLDDDCLDLKKRVDQHSRWHRTEAALAVPLIDDVGNRLGLLQTSRDMSAKWQSGDLSKPAAGDEDAKGADERQERLALAVVGPRGLKELGRKDQYPEKLKEYWQGLENKINGKLTASLESRSLDEAAAKLKEASFLSRLVPGGAAGFVEAKPFGPSEGLRRLRLHELFLWQAQRTVKDHWFADVGYEPRKEGTYYLPTAEAYGKIAMTLAETPRETAHPGLNKDRQKKAKELKDSLKLSGLRVSNQTSPFWTSEVSFPLQWRIDSDAGLPLPPSESVPMVWLDLAPALQALTDKKYLLRQALDKPDETRTYPLTRPAQTIQKSAPKLRAFYRGKVFEESQELVQVPPDTIVYHFPPPPKAGLVVRKDENFSVGAISIVLDCSGSMDEKDLDAAGKKSRYEFATDAFAKLLKGVPKGVHVTVSVFGAENNEKDTRIKWIRERDKGLWHPDLAGGIEAKLKNEVPYYASPIAEAIFDAKMNGFPQNEQPGSKIILVLSDGADTLFEKKEFVKHKNLHNRHATTDISLFLKKEFANSDTQVLFVSFSKKQKEIEAAEKQFGVVADLDTPGEFTIVNDGDKLAETLRKLLQPKYTLNPMPKGMERIGWPVDSNPKGSLTPDAYTLKVHNKFPHEMELKAGDFIDLSLMSEGNRIVFRRNLFAGIVTPELVVDKKSEKGALVSMLQNQIDPKERTLSQLAIVEDQQNLDNLKHDRPAFLWFEVQAEGGQRGRLKWHKDYRYPAPAFRAEVKDWPGDGVAAQSKLWWTKDDPFRKDLDYAVILEQADLKPGKKIRLGGKDIGEIYQVEEEAHHVSPADGNEGKNPTPCLVVRIRHELGKPVMVLLQPKELAQRSRLEEMHQYYPKARNYTAYFSGVSLRDEFSLRVIALEEFKSVAPLRVSFQSLLPNRSEGPDPVPEDLLK